MRLAIAGSVAVGELECLAQAIFTIPRYYPCYAQSFLDADDNHEDTSPASVCCIVCPIFLHSPLLYCMEDRTELSHHFVSALHRGLRSIFRQFHQLVENNTRNNRDCFFLLIGFLYLLIPRRPDVFHIGLVDQQYTADLIGWITFSWVGKLLNESKRSADLSIKDVLELNSKTRASRVHNSLKEIILRCTAFISKDPRIYGGFFVDAMAYL